MKLMKPVIFVFFMMTTLVLASLSFAEPLLVPGGTAYLEPNPQPPGMDVSAADGVTGWSDAHNTIVWYGQFAAPGRLDLAVSLHLPAAQQSQIRLTVAGQSRTAQVVGIGAAPVRADFGSVIIPKAGIYPLILHGVSKTGATFGDVETLQMDGPATQEAHFSQAQTRGAPSVHLWYQYPPDTHIAWFYNEVTVKSDPLWSYYMACGFARGYFGIQVNSPTERHIIFSVWNAGNEPTDPSKVPADDRVQLLAKGPNVFTSDFGNEGTGGHSHLVYPWKIGHTYRFLVSAQPDGTATVYSGYFYFPEKKRWGLIASYRAPKDGGWLRGLYSFNEDWNPANGQKRRQAEFGPTWIRTDTGQWIEMTAAHFTFTSDGQTERLDRSASVDGSRFVLSNGGFVPVPAVKYGDTFTHPATRKPPTDITLPTLPAPRVGVPGQG